MRFGRLFESAADLAANGDRSRQEIDGALLKCARRRGTQKNAGGVFEGLQRDIHRLELRFAAANQRAKGHKAEVLVEFELSWRAGNDSEIVTSFDAMLPKQCEDALEDLSATEFFIDGEQTNFADFAASGQIGIEILEFLIEREGAIATNGQHAGQLASAQTNKIRVFGMKFIYEPMGGLGFVLRDFFNKRFVIEPMD